jgi:D-arabinose 1-dehydrogenase-like Zn-dependent alcohol dehydrogenase
MDILSLDEVQGMSLGQIDKVYERMSARKIRFRFMLSTANIPDAE